MEAGIRAEMALNTYTRDHPSGLDRPMDVRVVMGKRRIIMHILASLCREGRITRTGSGLGTVARLVKDEETRRRLRDELAAQRKGRRKRRGKKSDKTDH